MDLHTARDALSRVHIGRQPIYDTEHAVIGYELLFRGSASASAANRRGAHATGQVILNAFTEFGLDNLVGDRLCFINLTREFLTGDLPLPFPPGLVVLEILETVEVDDEVIAGVLRLVEAGFPVALDDFVLGTAHERLLAVADYAKVDFMALEPDAIRDVVERCRRYPKMKLVAERLESRADVVLAHRMGFHLLQGYALSRPQTLTRRALSPQRVRRLELFAALYAQDVDVERVVSIVHTDPALSYQVLRATNSAASGLPRRISSVREATTFLGMNRVRQWLALMLITDVAQASDDHLGELIARARLCQTLADRLGGQGDVAFTVGLLAGVADLLGQSVESVVAGLPLATPVAEALLTGTGIFGEVLTLVRSYESADFATLSRAALPTVQLSHDYLAAVSWSRRTLSGLELRRENA